MNSHLKKSRSKIKSRKGLQGSACPYCRSPKIVLRGFRRNLSGDKQLFLCKNCGRKFTHDNGYLRMRFSPSAIKEAVSLCRKGYSLAETQKNLERRGTKVSRWTILKWVRRFGD